MLLNLRITSGNDLKTKLPQYSAKTMSSSLWTTEANGYLTFCVSVAFLYSVIFCFFNCDFIKKLDQIINENLSSEKLSIKYLTDTMAMSRASLYNKVKQITGLGVNEYINRLRIERSVYLLANTNLSISEISYEVGFSYPRYFSTSFKQMKGVTPSQFKEKNKNSGHI